MAKESELSRSIFKTRDAAEGLAAFAERRKPEYWGV
jgi:enoyl-CoA hydratase/carnithine racemase